MVMKINELEMKGHEVRYIKAGSILQNLHRCIDSF